MIIKAIKNLNYNNIIGQVNKQLAIYILYFEI